MIDICSILEAEFELVFEEHVLLFQRKSLAGMSDFWFKRLIFYGITSSIVCFTYVEINTCSKGPDMI